MTLIEQAKIVLDKACLETEIRLFTLIKAERQSKIRLELLSEMDVLTRVQTQIRAVIDHERSRISPE
jgi:hypothetical protein